MSLNFGHVFGATALSNTLINAPTAVGAVFLSKFLDHKNIFKTQASYMNDEFHRKLSESVDKGLKKNEVRKLKWMAALYAIPLALPLVLKGASFLVRSVSSSRQQVATGVQHAGDKVANTIHNAANQSASVVKPTPAKSAQVE